MYHRDWRAVVVIPVAAALALLLFATSAVALSADYWVNRSDHCISSGLKPREPAGLNFCTWYHSNACCLPAIDHEILENYFAALSLGPGCSSSSHLVKATHREMRDLMCLPCDPHEPKFRFQTRYGDGFVPADPSIKSDSHFTWRICRSFLYGNDGKSGLWGGDGTKYDRCGFYHAPDCESFPQYGFNPTTNTWTQSEYPAQASTGHKCDPQLIIPSLEFAGEAVPAEKMIQFLPMVLPMDFHFVVVNDTAPGFSYARTPCFRGSAAIGVALHRAVAAVFFVLVALVTL